jgi:HSP20 family molecular chaperone IbpA
MSSQTKSQTFPVNVYEAEAAVVVVAPLPAVMSDDVEITIDGRELRISAAQRTDAPKDYLVQEWTYGPYDRTVELPEGFGAGVEATLNNGQLAVRVLRGAGGGAQTINPS